MIRRSLTSFLVVVIVSCLSRSSTTAFPSTVLVDPTVASVVVVEQPSSTTPSSHDVTPTETQDNLMNNDVEKQTTKHLKPKITSMHVESNVSLRYARTLVTSRVSNPASRANEVTFSVVIPETAFITGFSMEIEGKVYEAYVKEKAEAKKDYQTAVSSGIAAAHVAVQARDSNHFTVSVNVEAESKAVFRLRYEELLSRRLGLYNLVMNLSPGQLLDDLAVDVNIHESSPISNIFVPSLRTGNEVDADPTDAPNEYSTYTLSDDKLNAKVHFAPNKQQQMELLKIFKERQKASTPSPIPYYSFDSRPTKPAADEDGLKGQFVVQYDVDRDVKGEIMLNDGYFVHFFAPKDLEPLNKHVIFVLDVSGSMAGRKVNQLKDAMTSILQDLKPGDYFSIIDFNYNARVYNLDDLSKNAVFRSSDYFNMYGDEEEDHQQPKVIPPPKPATTDNIAKAKKIIEGLEATGGTNIYDALTTALKVANLGIQQSTAVAESNQEKPLPEPMIIFLTDGDPTVGETNTDKILSAVKDTNPKNVALFSLAFGEDADRGFLRRVSLQNSGFMRHIYEAADAAHQLRHFYKQVASPLLANITLTYPKEQIDEESLTKKSFHYFFSGSELVIAGRVKDKDATETSIVLNAKSIRGPIDFIPIVPAAAKRTKFWPLERMWAYLTIKQLLDEKDTKTQDLNSKDNDGPTKKALELALKYSFVTPLTSLVVVKPNSTAAVDAESVDASGAGVGASYALPLIVGGAASMIPPPAPFPSWNRGLAPVRQSAMILQPTSYSSHSWSQPIGFSGRSVLRGRGKMRMAKNLIKPATMRNSWTYPRHSFSSSAMMSFPDSYKSTPMMMPVPLSGMMHRPQYQLSLDPTVALPGKPQPLWLSPAAAVGDEQVWQGRSYHALAMHSAPQQLLFAPSPIISLQGPGPVIERFDDIVNRRLTTNLPARRFSYNFAAKQDSFGAPGPWHPTTTARIGSFQHNYMDAHDTMDSSVALEESSVLTMHPDSDVVVKPDGDATNQEKNNASTDQEKNKATTDQEKNNATTDQEKQTEEKKDTVATTDDSKANVTVVAKPEDKLKPYGLEAYAWLEKYLNANEDSITLPLPDDKHVTLKLKNKSQSATTAESQDKSCGNSVGGKGSGVCQYISQCKDFASSFTDLTTYLNHYCDANGFAGICCKVETP